MFPVIEKMVIYISSDGHSGMGIRYISLNRKPGRTWSEPENLNILFNSSKDDFEYYL